MNVAWVSPGGTIENVVIVDSLEHAQELYPTKTLKVIADDLGYKPGVGWVWNSDTEEFNGPQLFPSWTLNATTREYEPPVDFPQDAGSLMFQGEESDDALAPKSYYWDEDLGNWVEMSPGSDIPDDKLPNGG